MALFSSRRRPDPSAIPDARAPFAGEFYVDFMGALSRQRATGKYLEIGVQSGKLLAAIHADDATGVDPVFLLEHNVCTHKRKTTLHQLTSDDYFETLPTEEKFDLIFIDGMHLFEYALRDFFNAEKAARPGGLIVLHDCLPVTATMIERLESDAIAKSEGTPFDGWWTGDVWKLIPILREMRPDLRIVAVDCPPTGLLCVTKLDPASDVLQTHYSDIVDRYSALPNTWESVQQMYETLEIVASGSISPDMIRYFED